MLTRFVRRMLAKHSGPFALRRELNFLPEYDELAAGLYIHVPFCSSLCAFCPYYKTLYDADSAARFVDALIKEITMTAERATLRAPLTSLYFGGGSPALLASSLEPILKHVRRTFALADPVGLEVHPRDVTEHTLDVLKSAGVTMLSLGAQSFQPRLLAELGRCDSEPAAALDLIARRAFDAVDCDLIFGIPGQSVSDIRDDFKRAAALGATQISTYPFIDFSYAANSAKPLGAAKKKNLLAALLETARETGFERTSVWTFAKKNTPHYSSITRDAFIGFGPSAASLGRSDFKLNVFSVDEYIKTIEGGNIPSALRLHFTEQSRAAYWLFWNCYTGALREHAYYNIFKRGMEDDFAFFLAVGKFLRLLAKDSDGGAYRLTPAGSYVFHRVEQLYTHAYIDATWRASLETPWPAEITLY